MGDRRAKLEESMEYFHRLELFMDTVSEEVARKGLEPPLFHVFTETLIPCPSEDAGIFDEFPSWPMQQVRKQCHKHTLRFFRWVRGLVW